MSKQSKATHTPGPWTCDGADIMGPETRFRDKETPLATASVESEQWPANARLIAAAPELLEALEQLMRAEPMQQGKRDGATMGEISKAIDMARAAIAKAKQGASHESPL